MSTWDDIFFEEEEIDEPLHPYWNAWQIVDDAYKAGQVSAAGEAFSTAVGLMESSILAAIEDIETAPEFIHVSDVNTFGPIFRTFVPSEHYSYPLTEREAFAFAAAHSDLGSLEILDLLCERFGLHETSACGDTYLRIVDKVKSIVSEKPVTSIYEVRRAFDAEDRIRLRSVWRALENAGAFYVERQGNAVYFHQDAPEPDAQQ